MLYIVATPIGNLDEITFRAVEVLRSVDLIAAEDTRRTLTLLNRYDIKNKVISYQKFSEKSSSVSLIELLKEGKNIALVSDAGMPLISDPGSVLVAELIKNDIEYTVISGACAAINALVLSGMDTSRFLMLGFLPEKKIDRDELIEKYKNVECTLIFYCAPHDILKDIDYLFSMLGARKFSIAREISKIFEEVRRGVLGQPLNLTQKGEMVLVVEGKNPSEDFLDLSVLEHYQRCIAEGLSNQDAMKKVARSRKIAKSLVYKELLQSEKSQKSATSKEVDGAKSTAKSKTADRTRKTAESKTADRTRKTVESKEADGISDTPLARKTTRSQPK